MEGLHTPEKVWFELHREKDACDVLVQMDDGTVYTALFAVSAYIQRQMDLAREKMEDQGMSASQIQSAEEMTRLFMNPGMQFVVVVIN